MATIVHDLPPSLKLEGGLFTAGATVIPGGLTSAGIGLQKIVPGGRATLIARYYPVRRDAVPNGSLITLRPMMLGRVQDPQGFAQAIGHNQSYAPAEVTFVEALI